ncbi:zinc finger protein 585A-like [Ischnura elegans]|uniref:zinc finger protein 585A-like n=1 Tax=Ischnura elegans TaxID=197161 RepID=UPI001ED8A5E7|nr:zinc finger protein 585A-like [Ischnura elegans]XP_046382753.1 zinc finger protein 585A-like [Ischnura elegans]XP_046382754.1 zinc finger protein 585A-like [Ischnura elegans]XP_046382756.1 zinc finger protein 585A-like [Ischnura elegans]XP_046382757.1 zinc finger protein 585A-like [Ischnura elegans]
MDEELGWNSNSLSSFEETQGNNDGGSTPVARCRLCVDGCEELVPIFSERGKEMQLGYNINKLLPSMIHPLDKLPQEVCMPCIEELNAVCKFMNKCISSQAKLRNMLYISQQDDGISLKALQKYSSHWPVPDSVKKMGHTREIHASRTKRPLSVSEEERNEQVKRLKSSDMSNDDGSSNQSLHCAEDIGEMDADILQYDIDCANDGNSVESDREGRENSAVVEEPNTSALNDISDVGFHDDKSNASESVKYLCKFCGEGFLWKADLFEHQSIEHSELVIRCVYCRKVFYDKNELVPHEIAHEKLLPPKILMMNKVKTPQKRRRRNLLAKDFSIRSITSSISTQNSGSILPYSSKNKHNDRICYYCNLIFPTLRSHRKHIKTVHHIQFPCRFCAITCESKSKHRDHEARHLRKAMICVCKKKFFYEDEFRDHALIHVHETDQLCEICGDAFDCQEHLEEHIKTHDGENSYLCEVCGEGMESFFLFRVHKLSHMYPGMHRCVLCNFCFNRAEDLENHLENVHHVKKITCGSCGEEFVTMQLLKEHRAKRKCIDASCEVCGKSFPCMSKLRDHAEIHSSVTNYLCDKCGWAFKRKDMLRAHILTSHSNPIPCEVCGRKFKSQQSLITHRQRHFGEKTVICSVCGKSFFSKSDLSYHMIRHEEPKVPCPMCGILFTRKIFMLYHMRRHRVACEICGEVFENTPLLVEHQKVHAKEGNIPPSDHPEFPKCHICGKQFLRIMQLRHHLPLHSEERPFQCNLCDKSYRRKKDLAKHTDKKHGEPKPYQCSYCPCTFRTEQVLLKHENGHTLGKPYNCAMCGVGFWSPLHLERHLVKHASSNWSGNYQCKDCGKTFPHKNTLIAHQSTHAKPLNFKCPFCPRKFSRRGYLLKHKCQLKPRIQASSTSFQSSIITDEVSTITADDNAPHHIPTEVPGVGENVRKVSESVDFYKHLEKVTNCTLKEANAPSVVIVESSDEEEYMPPVHPHLQHPHSSKTVQLVDDIPVYIRKRLFENMPISTVSPTTLARNLADQIFTEEALRTCSVKGQRQNSHSVRKREPLCPLGTAAIIAFVQKTNDALGRPPVKSSDLVMAMGHRLSELRRRAPLNPVMDISPVEVTMDIDGNPILEIEIY